MTLEVRNPLLRRNEAAEYLGVAPATLAKWAWAGRGPAMIKLGARAVRYRRSDLDRFIDESSRRSTSDRGPAR